MKATVRNKLENVFMKDCVLFNGKYSGTIAAIGLRSRWYYYDATVMDSINMRASVVEDREIENWLMGR